MEIKAAVTPEKGKAFEIKDIELPEPGAKDVLVQIKASGICHTDVSGRDTDMVDPPSVLGHEGAGIVEETGSEVTGLQKGDHVVISFASCGECENCKTGHPAHCKYYGDLNLNSHVDENNELTERFFGQSSFATYSLANERNVVKIDEDIDLALAAPLGCGLQTGASTVLNVLKPEKGSTIAVFGVGAVGLSAIMAAKIAGCEHIIGIDLHENRLELAETLGATATIASGKDVNVAEKIEEITGSGVHNVLDTTGANVVIDQAVRSLESFGKLATVVTDYTFEVPLEMLALKGGSIIGTSQGDATPQEFIPQMIEYYKKGQFPFDRMVKYYDFDEINKAFEESESGSVIKPVLRME